MKLKVRVLWVFAVALVSFFVLQVPAANADTIEYQVTGVGSDFGTNFTYISTAGYVTAASFPIVPTTATDLFLLVGLVYVDEGAISSLIDTDMGNELEMVAAHANFVFDGSVAPILFPSAPGNYTDYLADGTTIAGTVVVTDLTTAPEPGVGGLMLLGLGSLGLMMVMRKRTAGNLSQAA